jgi:hypothetical protein
MPHAWKEGSAIYPHIHWRQTATTAVGWNLEYTWFNVGTTVPAVWATTTLNTNLISFTSGTMHQLSYSTLPIYGTGQTLSSLLLMKVYRNDATTAGDVLGYAVDVHYQKDSLGSRTETAK